MTTLPTWFELAVMALVFTQGFACGCVTFGHGPFCDGLRRFYGGRWW